ncbi:PD-(D/E)XK nuclease family protein [Chloroflexota bacterium]
MELPDDFQFSQKSLQDYVDCKRRFLLRYIMGILWPAIETEPVLENERIIQLGAEFHQLLHQHLLGIPEVQLHELIHDEELRSWWESYLDYAVSMLEEDESRYPEIKISAPIEETRIVAKFDLLQAKTGGRWILFDWKTSRKRPTRKWLAERLQTRVYPYMLVRSGIAFNQGKSIEPEMVQMLYWFPGIPGQPEKFCYDRSQFNADHAFLTKIVREITNLTEAGFALTPETARCRFCVYRSLCDRGVKAGALDDIEDIFDPESASDVEIDFDQIAEIEF